MMAMQEKKKKKEREETCTISPRHKAESPTQG